VPLTNGKTSQLPNTPWRIFKHISKKRTSAASKCSPVLRLVLSMPMPSLVPLMMRLIPASRLAQWLSLINWHAGKRFESSSYMSKPVWVMVMWWSSIPIDGRGMSGMQRNMTWRLDLAWTKRWPDDIIIYPGVLSDTPPRWMMMSSCNPDVTSVSGKCNPVDFWLIALGISSQLAT